MAASMKTIDSLNNPSIMLNSLWSRLVSFQFCKSIGLDIANEGEVPTDLRQENNA